MDMTDTITPNSDQLNADDLMSGPRTFTVERVNKGTAEQPVNLHLTETPGRPYRPSKSMRRILVAAWGKEADAYAGRRLTLYRDAEVTFGRDKVGGIKISHLSHIDKRLSVALTVTRGKRAPHVVEPLPDSAPSAAVEPSAEQIAEIADLNVLRDMHKAATSQTVKELIAARAADLKGEGGEQA